MSRHSYSWFVALCLFVFLLQATAPTIAGQVGPVPGGVRVPGTSVAREAPLYNWSEVTMLEIQLGNKQFMGTDPFRIFSLESVEGSQHWVERHYHWSLDPSHNPVGPPVVDNTEVYPTGTRMVYAVTGYYTPMFGPPSWSGYPSIRFALLVPVAGTRPGALRVNPPNVRANQAVLQRTPVAQTIGYQRVRAAPPVRGRPPSACDYSTAYPPKDPTLQASCVLLEPGQFVDLPNQTRILRVGESYRVMVGESLMEDLEGVITIIHTEGRYYTLRDLGVY